MRVDETPRYPGQALIDLDALAHNYRILSGKIGQADSLVIVKADAYGHGAQKIALALYEAGARWFGQAQLGEALQLAHAFKKAGLPPLRTAPTAQTPRIFSWISVPGLDGDELRVQALENGIDLSISNLEELVEIVAAAQTTGICARVHLKVDVGNSRAGCPRDVWDSFFSQTALAQADGKIKIVAIWSHLQSADDPAPEAFAETKTQIQNYELALEVAKKYGIIPEIRHLAATSGGLWHPESRYDLVRWGIGLYGLSPNSAHETAKELGLKPVMRLRAPLLSVKEIPAGQGVSYNATWRAERNHWVGLVPLGYADGIPRLASNRAGVSVHTREGIIRARVIGRICMDQFVIDLGINPPAAKRGDTVELFGNETEIDDWAKASQSVNYEIITRLGPRVERIYYGQGETKYRTEAGEKN
ncbi:alanine racemase [Actinomycetaceae bacterium TAE3-ERU4]|nr:alanine racemase [Actinomycetaceae bacterium TAE3-ERU4]